MKVMKKTMETYQKCYIFGLIIAMIFYVLSLIGIHKPEIVNNIWIIVNIISVLIFCIILSQLIFDILLQPETHKRLYYFGSQFLFTFLPFVLLERYKEFDYLYVAFISFGITLISIYFLYRKLKKIEKINIKHIEYLKHYNILLTTIFIIIKTIIDLIISGKGATFYLVYVTPLMLWQFFYSEIIIQRKHSGDCYPN
jgi:hypothetical protein